MKRSIRHISSTLILAACVLLLEGCDYGLHEALGRSDGVSTRSVTLSDIQLPPGQQPTGDTYSFVIFTDFHYGKTDAEQPEEAFKQWLRDLKIAGGDFPLFALALGDMADHGHESEYAHYKTFTDSLKTEPGIAITTYGVVGNHDLYNSGWKYWRQYVYPYNSFYRFKTPGRSWYFLDTGNGTTGAPQMKAFLSAIASDPTPAKFVFSHYPLYGGQSIEYFYLAETRERSFIIDACARSGVQVYFCGHYHPGGFFDYGSFKEVVLGAFSAKTKRAARWTFVTVDEAARTVVTREYSSEGGTLEIFADTTYQF